MTRALFSQIRSGDASTAMDIFLDMPCKLAHSELRRIVCTHYWRLSALYFEVEGFLGWGPGFFDGRERFTYVQGAERKLYSLLSDMCVVQPMPEVMNMLRSKKLNMIRVKMSERYDGHCPVTGLYNMIGVRGSGYELAAAKVYYKMFCETAAWEVPLAGLLLISSERLNKRNVNLLCCQARIQKPVLSDQIATV